MRGGKGVGNLRNFGTKVTRLWISGFIFWKKNLMRDETTFFDHHRKKSTIELVTAGIFVQKLIAIIMAFKEVWLLFFAGISGYKFSDFRILHLIGMVLINEWDLGVTVTHLSPNKKFNILEL